MTADKLEEGTLFSVDHGSCVGCLICEIVCSIEHHQCTNPHLSYIRVNYSSDGKFQVGVCNSCQLCAESCPKQALDIGLTNGVQLDSDLCDGCGSCIEVCPHSLAVWEAQREEPLFCNLCGRCAEACPTQAIEIKSKLAA